MPGVEISRGRRPPEDDGMRPMARAALGAQLLAMIVLLAAPGSLAAASSRSLQHQAEAVVPLRTHVDGYTLIRDDGRTCHELGSYVKRGNPLGCGHGCQYVSASFASRPQTSSTFKRTGDFFGKPHPIVGPPDAWPSNEYSDYAWSPQAPNDGEEWITIRTKTPTIVSGLEIYEVNNPGSIIEIRGRLANKAPEQQPDEEWLTLWTGPPQPSPVNGNVDSLGRRLREARVFRPALKAPKTKPLDEFYLRLNTSAVLGFGQIDAVKVIGSLEDGMPIQDYQPGCIRAEDNDCWASCREADLLTHERLESSMELLREAASWLPKLLRVQPAGPSRLVLPLPPDVDPEWVGCGDLELPRAPFVDGLPGAELAVFPTIRPAPEPLSVSTCLRSGRDGQGRPVAIRLNMVPQYAELAHYNNSLDAARDAVLQQLFLAIGWSSDYHPRLVELWGPSAIKELYPCSNSSACSAGWSVRRRLMANTPSLVSKAAEHFGIGASALTEGVELEQTGSFAGNMLKLRIFNGELMTPSAFTDLARHNAASGWSFPGGLSERAKSAISLGLLEDLGWYFPHYAAAQTLGWGHKRGLDFALSPCNSWPDKDSTYLCPRVSGVGSNFDVDALGRRGCNALRTHVGNCNFINHPSPLPPAYLYFSDPVNAVNHGGALEAADYCPIVVPEPSGLFGAPEGAEDCRVVGSQAVIGTNEYQNPGPGSACFSGRRSNLQAFSGCYKHFCDDKAVLWVVVGHQTLRCPLEGGGLSFVLFGVTLFCPPASEMCPQYASMVPPSVRVYSVTCSPTRGDCRPPAEVLNGRLSLGAEITNFELGRDGTLVALLDNEVIREWTSDPDRGQLRKVIQLDRLPQAIDVELKLELRDLTGKPLYTDSHMISVKLGPISRPATEVISASSEYSRFDGVLGDSSLPASALLGEQEVARARHSDDGKSWSPARGAAGEETLTLRFGSSLYPTKVVLYENLSPGSLSKVEARYPNGTYVTVWMGVRDPLEQRPMGFPAPNGFLSTGGSSAYDLKPAGVQTDILRLSFTTPPWPEIDTIKMVGYAELLPTAEMASGLGAVDAVVQRNGLPKQETLRLRIGGTSMLVWSLEPSAGEEWPDWLVPYAPKGRMHPLADGDVLEIPLTVVAQMGSPPTSSVTLVLRNTMLGGPAEEESRLLKFTFTRIVDYSTHPAKPPALCYHGMLARSPDPLVPDQCICSPGAYGGACEFLTCPVNCTSPVGLESLAAGATLHGLCDRSQGVCKCLPGYSGVDCSGQDGDCYISYSGNCRAGWEPGRFMLNAEDENNLNRGAGLLPKGFQCPDERETCYQNVVAVQFCCRAPVEPACPFEAGAAGTPCKSDDCAEVTYNWTAPACLVRVHEYCFFAPGDAACHAFRPLPIPPDFCPLEVALAWCAGDGAATPECFDTLGSVGQEPGSCAFRDAAGSPCRYPPCQADALSWECEPFVVQWCDDHPEDPECEAHLAGDECLFAPGSPPCVEPACLPESYSERGCREAVDFHCGSTAGRDDPECGMEGFGAPPPHAKPSDPSSCPWAAIRSHCRSQLGGATAGCRLLAAYGALGEAPVIPADASSLRAASSVLKAAAEKEAARAREAFDAFAISREKQRRRMVARYTAYRRLFRALDGDLDKRIVASELRPISRAVRAAKAELDLSPLGANWVTKIPPDELLEVLEPEPGTGNFVTYAVFAHTLEELYQGAVLQGE